ncbi:hypothetical protein [Streptomyces griseoloalbus]|uniref:Uncharacterized protein n=1 Tax=Streptomyces griseoloalbus TaxID=67303 RepID=A0A7W8BM31_9ACTN|nr:hypothetical protein [Streptomyces albaduncus]MBB5125886.1 hypothetical protein [Streptomyces albaduncus]
MRRRTPPAGALLGTVAAPASGTARAAGPGPFIGTTPSPPHVVDFRLPA